MFLMFNGNSCTLRMDTMQMAGVYSLAGDTLRMQFQNGSAQSWRCFMDGSALILDGSMQDDEIFHLIDESYRLTAPKERKAKKNT